MSSPLEPIEAIPGTFDVRAMARGEPGVPRRFRWRDREYVVTEVVATARETEPYEGYVRRHVTHVRTEGGNEFRIVGDRGGRRGAPRWWVRSAQAPQPGS